MGEKTAQGLQKHGIHSVFDLLIHLPLRYEDRTLHRPLARLKPGVEQLILGQIVRIQTRGYGRKRTTHLILEDKKNNCCDVFLFNLPVSRSRSLQPGLWFQGYGKIEIRLSGPCMLHPQFRVFEHAEQAHPEPTLTPVYPLWKGMQQYRIRRIINAALEQCRQLVKHRSSGNHANPADSDLLQIFHTLHCPAPDALLNESVSRSRKQLAHEELLAHTLVQLRQRSEIRQRAAIPMNKDAPRIKDLLERLPFKLTEAQKSASKTIIGDLSNPGSPMLRLLQGEVGSGKTIVAALAALHCVENGWSCAIMAPTELLAMQHFESFSTWLAPLGITVLDLTSKTPEKKARIDKIRQDGPKILVGTQALIQDGVDLANLGLCIIDEQHRFGVNQRLLLLGKGGDRQPHQLIMSATPIPRTLAMTYYAGVEISTLDELPSNRKPVQTLVMPETKRNEVIQRIQHLCHAGQQVYWVCPLIEAQEEGTPTPFRSSIEIFDILQKSLPDLSIGMVHGQMPANEKQSLMTDFRNGKLSVLVSTTVIEVGIDVPNATLIVIENAERLGLSQLHQLRGRVGRGTLKGFCILLYSNHLSKLGKTRLAVLRESNNGFEIAEKDLKMRGPGELWGVRQSGGASFRIASPDDFQAEFPKLQARAQHLLKNQADMAEIIIKRWLPKSDACNRV
ncbi:MAG: ATP-dependent DNA helicase RecG [Gammaproteobacteria bacterium]|nr:MAG: ATP-dependent DNA helicase RecG [Gammaproteobacteria bacterium]